MPQNRELWHVKSKNTIEGILPTCGWERKKYLTNLKKGAIKLHRPSLFFVLEKSLETSD